MFGVLVMTACEICWSHASFRAALGQGHTADLYHEEVAAHPEHHDGEENA